tara:strand:+ start:605 stop:1552 length:948 start_codon:yes stop_codon:yes gene_type:complete
MVKVKTKNSTISVVMYHYVREVKNSHYPNLKGLEFNNFKNQINFFDKNFNILSNNDFNEIISTKKIPLKPSVLLTFDDGYIDHYKYVFPFLKKKKIKANFYPPKKVIENKIVLDVNKTQFILEKEQNSKKILKEIDNLLIREGKKPISDNDKKKINLSSRFDDKETLLVKRLLQFYLPQKLREKITNLLFKKILNISLNDFSKSLYMNEKQIKEMYNENMSFGSHGDYHYWWEYLKKKDQEKEIKNSINFFKKINFDTNSLSVCFPYGSHNNETLKLLSKYNISYALTAKPGIINKKNLTNHFTYPRLDTNDFPS